MPDLDLEMEVNGRRIAKRAAPSLRLLDFLRDELALTGAKEGCGAGECGTCSVFVDGKLVKSCLMPAAKANGARIETIEGLAAPGDLTPVQRAFHKTGASQCGYCIPGKVIAPNSSLLENQDAALEENKELLGGKISRCTVYSKIFEAVESARDGIAGRVCPAVRVLRRTGGQRCSKQQEELLESGAKANHAVFSGEGSFQAPESTCCTARRQPA